MYDDNSVSTFHQRDNKTKNSCTTSTKFTPVIVSNPPSILESSTSESRPNNVNYQDAESISKLTDTQTCISTLEQDIRHLDCSFQSIFSEMKLQSQQQASQQQRYDAALAEILELLKRNKVSLVDSPNIDAVQDNPPKQPTDTGGSHGAAGPG
jgi:hypothetical protein